MNLKTATYFVAIISALFMYSDLSYSASFNCAKAKSKVEKSICADKELSGLDEEMATAYKTVMKTHPLPDYVRSRQKDWISSNQYCDPKKFSECLKNRYKARIAQLTYTSSSQVFSNSKKFSYTDGDAVVEISPESGGMKMIVWGGFFIHNIASQDQGKPVYVGCEFEGKIKDPGIQVATDKDGSEIRFTIKGDTLQFESGIDEKICAGFGRMPEDLQRVN